MNKMQMMLAYKNGKEKSYFKAETERLIREKYSEKDEMDILRNMLYDGDSLRCYLEDLQKIRKNVKETMESAVGKSVDVGFDPEKQTTGMIHRVGDVETATSIAFVTMAENGVIDDATAAEHTALFAPWANEVTYKAGAIRKHGGKIYRCVQAHTAQEDWTPDAAASLWTLIGDPAEEYPAWSQPIGAHDAYMTGDKVTYDDKKWASTVDNNVWMPGVYGWEEVV